MINKVGVYIFLILIYLGVAKGLSNQSERDLYLKDEKVFANYFREAGAPVSIILQNYFTAGFFIKSHYHYYKIVYGFKKLPRFVIARVSKQFFESYRPYLGMSIYHKNSTDFEESLIPVPPGGPYVGDLAFGVWTFNEEGEKIWSFYNAYSSFPQMFSWGKFRPNYEFHQRMKFNVKREQAFFGLNNEFGTDGDFTKAVHYSFFAKDIQDKITMNQYFSKLLSIQSAWLKNE
jgi:hypothetical protein